jgi:hypothetical protein
LSTARERGGGVNGDVGGCVVDVVVVVVAVWLFVESVRHLRGSCVLGRERRVRHALQI